jgi:shikimate kinase
MEKKSLVYLTGFMGAGKSTIGSILANTLGWDYYDLDKLIEAECKKKISDIFKENGEKKFREIESELLKKISTKKFTVISLGGGTIVNEINLQILKNTGTIVYLKSSLDSIYKRVRFKRDRPVLKLDESGEPIMKENFIDSVTKIFESRKPYYEQADVIIDTDNTNVGASVDKLVRYIERFNRKEK